MKRVVLCLVFLLVMLTAVTPIQAQGTPTPVPTVLPPTPFSNPLDGAGGLPSPFAIPTPDPGAPTIDLDPFWDRDNLSDVVSAAMTIFVFIKNFVVIQVILIVLAFLAAWKWALGIVRGRQRNV